MKATDLAADRADTKAFFDWQADAERSSAPPRVRRPPGAVCASCGGELVGRVLVLRGPLGLVRAHESCVDLVEAN